MAFTWKNNLYFTNNSYVSISGSDLNDGAYLKPFKSVQKAIDDNKTNVQIGTGLYRESLSAIIKLYGDGTVKFDGTLYDKFIDSGDIYNLIIENYTYLRFTNLISKFINCKIKNIVDINGVDNENLTLHKCLIKDIANEFGTGLANLSDSGFSKNTLYNCNIRLQGIALNGGIETSYNENIFSNCNIHFIAETNLDYCLFHNCNFKFGNELTYTSLTGSTDDERFADLISRYNTVFPTSIFKLNNCKVTENNIFNNSVLDDFTLLPGSIASTMNYKKQSIGAFNIGFPTYVYDNDLGYPNSFYNRSAINFVITNNSLAQQLNINGDLLGESYIEEKPKDLLKSYEIVNNSSIFSISDNSNSAIDTQQDLDVVDIFPNTNLINGELYYVMTGTVTYNAYAYPVSSKFFATNNNSFTSSDGGILRKVIELPNRLTNSIRFKNTISNTQINQSEILNIDSWYRVYNSSIVFDSITYQIGDIFKCNGIGLTFTGSGYLIEEFTSADNWLAFEINFKPTVKKVGDVSNGAIDISNGDINYYNSTNISRPDFPIKARYIQKAWTIKINMLK